MLTFRPDLRMRLAGLLDVDPGQPRIIKSEGQD